MKKILIILFLLVTQLFYAQVTNVKTVRVADATTTFSENIPEGTQVYNVTTNELWVATGAVTSGSTLTTASGSFDLINLDGGDYLSSNSADTKTSGDLTFSDNIALNLGSDDDLEFYFGGSNSYMDLNVGDLYIRDNTTNRFRFARTSGYFYQGSDGTLDTQHILYSDTVGKDLELISAGTYSTISAGDTTFNLIGEQLIFYDDTVTEVGRFNTSGDFSVVGNFTSLGIDDNATSNVATFSSNSNSQFIVSDAASIVALRATNTQASSQAKLRLTNPDAYWEFINDATGNFLFGEDDTNFPFQIQTGAPTNSLKIESDGDVLMGGLTNRFKFDSSGIFDWGSTANYGRLTWDTNEAIVAAQAGSSLTLQSGGSDAVTIDTSQNVDVPNGDLSVSGNNVYYFDGTKKLIWFGDSQVNSTTGDYVANVDTELGTTGTVTQADGGDDLNDQIVVLDGLISGDANYFTAYDIVLFHIGVNDFNNDNIIGNLSDTSSTLTFIGQLKDFIDTVLTSNPECEIYFITPPETDTVGLPYKSTNGAGHTLEDYARAMVQVAASRSVFSVDFNSLLGMNETTMATYSSDDLHITTTFGKAKAGRIVADAIRRKTSLGLAGVVSNTAINEAVGTTIVDTDNYSRIYGDRVLEQTGTYETLDAFDYDLSSVKGESLQLTPSGRKVDSLYVLNVKDPYNSSADLAYTRASTATVVNVSGQVEKLANDMPRIDYSRTDTGVILVEPSVENDLLQTEDMSTSWIAEDVTVTTNATYAPDGTLTADKIVENIDNDDHFVRQYKSGLTNTTDYTFSVFVKAAERYKFRLNMHSAYTTWDLRTGTRLNGTAADDSIVEYADGWYRVSITVESINTFSNHYLNIIADDDSVIYTGDSSKGLYVWGAQLEEASYSTSYIPTTTTTVTRSAETYDNGDDIDAGLLNTNEGVIFLHSAALTTALETSSMLISLSDGTTANQVTIGYGNTANNIKAQYFDNSLEVAKPSYTSTDRTQFHKIAFKWSQDDFALWVDGVEVATDNLGDVGNAAFTTLEFADGANSNPFHGLIKEFKVFPYALSDDELTALTSKEDFTPRHIARTDKDPHFKSNVTVQGDIKGETFRGNNILASADIENSNAFGGSETQPNLINKEIYTQYETGNGSTKAWNATSTFTVNDLNRIQIRVNVLRASDGVLSTYHEEGSGVTVNSGYGTSTVNVEIAAAPASGDLVEITIYGEDDDSGSGSLITTTAYDNAVSSIASNAFGSHGIIPSGGGHNTIYGGSYSRIWGDYNGAFGKGVWIGRNDATSIYNFGMGGGVQVDGDGNFVVGQNLTYEGKYGAMFGQDGNNNDFDWNLIFGRRAEAVGDGEMVQAGGRATDNADGIHQTRTIVLGLETTNATESYMLLPNGSGGINLPDDSAALVKVSAAAIDDAGTKIESWAGQFLVHKVSGTAEVNDSTGDVAVPSLWSIGSPTYNLDIRAITGTLRLRATGEASVNVRWTAKIEITQVKW